MRIEQYFEQLKSWVLDGLILAKTKWNYYLRMLKWTIVLSICGISFGVLVSHVGYRMLNSGIIDFGRVITGACSLIASCVVFFLIVRVGASLFGVSVANKLATGLVREGSRPLPSTPIEIPQLLDDESIKSILLSIGAVYAALAFLGAIATALPFYTTPGSFFVSLLFLVFIVYGASSWAPAGKWVERFQKGSLAFAVVSIIFLTVLCFFPGSVQRLHDRALLDAAQRQTEALNFPTIQGQIQEMQREKNAVLSSSSLTMEQKTEKLRAIDAKIEFIRNGGSGWFDWLPSWLGGSTVYASPTSGNSYTSTPSYVGNGKEVTVTVPQSSSTWSQSITVSKGDIIEVSPSGQVKARSDGPAVSSAGETSTGYCDGRVDSKYSCNVGGLEMGIGSNRKEDRILIDGTKRITAYESGKIYFRTIDKLNGFKGTGAFSVVVKKIS